MPIINRQDAEEVDQYIRRLFDAPGAGRAQALRRLFVEKLDFASAASVVSLAKAPKNVALPSTAERIATMEGLHVVYVPLSAPGPDRVRKAEAATAAKLIADELHGDILLVITNPSCSQLHVIWPTFTGASPYLRRMVIERDLPRRTAVMQLSNVYWHWKDTSSIRMAVDRAFDVQAVTRKFYDKYREIFEKVEELITGFGADAEKKRLFTQRLFNRLMFIAFIQRKGWLKIDGKKDVGYLTALWEASRKDKAITNFYNERLQLVFVALNSEHNIAEIPGGPLFQPTIGTVRYVNGGLFDDKEDIEEANAVTVPDEAIRLILTELFEAFNFTVMESSPLDVEVAVDPEMLGVVFEELVTGRHESGSYYTPKPVVSFMAREALKGFLQTACPSETKTAITLFVEEHKPDGLRDAEEVLAALKHVRVCDPACGSGAYLLGMLHELLDLRQALFATGAQDAPLIYNLKLDIIQNCVYGVDNDPFAVNIARLRLWLSLAVEFDGDSPPPLPNLDFKIEQGDSLAAPWPEATTRLTFQDELVKRFRDKKGAYLTAHRGPKDTLRKEIDGLRSDIGQWAHGKNKIAGFDWIVEFAEVFTSDGFDIVIANPPYRRQEGLGAEKVQLERLYPQVYASTADYHVYFYNRSLQLLRDGGVLSFITSNKYMRAGYGEKVRGFLPAALTMSQVIDFGDLPVFTAAAYPAIVVGQKTPPKEGHTMRVADLAAPVRCYLTAQGKAVNRETVTAVMERLPAFLAESAVPAYPQVLLRKSGWILEDPALVRLFDRLMSQGTPLGKFVNGSIYAGIKTGLNDAFVINEAKQQELIKADPRSAEVIKPWLRGKDVKRWRVEPAGQYLIAIQNSDDKDAPNPWGKAQTEQEARRIFRQTYPVIHEHLSSFEQYEVVDKQGRKKKVGLRLREDQGKWWWELRACKFYREFAKSKVVWPDITRMTSFAWDTSGAYADMTLFFTTGLQREYLSLLNSIVAQFMLTFLTYSIRGGYLRLKRQWLKLFPIPALEQSVIKALQHDGDHAEQVATEVAFAAYNLSPDESRLLQAWYINTDLTVLAAHTDSPDDTQEDE